MFNTIPRGTTIISSITKVPDHVVSRASSMVLPTAVVQAVNNNIDIVKYIFRLVIPAIVASSEYTSV
jgi:hypothetical protein